MTVKCSKYAGTSIFKNLEITTLRFQDTYKVYLFSSLLYRRDT